MNHVSTRSFLLALVLCLCGARAGTAAPGDLYVADPGTGSIYVVPTDSANAAPELLSARTTIFTEKLVHLGTTEIAFVPDGQPTRVVLGDFSGNSLRTIVSLGEQDRIVALGSAPTTNELAIISYRANAGSPQWVIFDAVRGAAASPWTATEQASLDAPGSNLGPPAIMKLATSVYTAAIPTSATISGLRFLDFRSQPPSNTLLAALGEVRLERGPGSTWMCLTPGGASLFFDLEGNPAFPPEAASVLLSTSSAPVVARRSAQPPQLAVVTHGELQVSSSPFGAGEMPETVYNSRAANALPTDPIIPEKDITGATTLVQENATNWLTHDPLLEGLYRIDTAAGTRSKEYFLEVGSGPAFGFILDMACDPDGKLYVLDEVVGARRIVGVDTRTGARRVVVTGLGDTLLPKLFAVAGGEFRVAEHRLFTYPVGSSPSSEVKLVLWRIVPGQDPAVYTEEQLATVVADIAPFDAAMTDSGEFRALFPTGADRFVMRREGSGFVPEFPLAIAATNVSVEVISNPNPSVDVVGTFPVPEDVASLETRRLRLLCGIRGVDRNVTPITYELGPIGATTYSGPLGIYNYPALSYSLAVSSNIVDPPPGGFAAGAVPVRVKLPCCSGYQNLALSQMTLVSAISIHPRFLWSLEDGSQMIYEVLPPALLKVDASPLSMQRTDVVDEQGGEAAAELSHPADFVVDEAAGVAYVSIADPHRLYKIDLATGASVLLSEGKPAILQEDKAGTGGDYAPQIAIVPRAERTTLRGGWVVR